MLHDILTAEARKGDGLDAVRLDAVRRARTLIGILDRRRAEIQGDGTPRRDEREHRMRRAAIEKEAHDFLKACSGSEGRASLLCLLAAADYEDVVYSAYGDAIKTLAARLDGWRPDEVTVMLLCAFEYRTGYWCARALEVALIAAERLDPGGLRETGPRLRDASRRFAREEVAIGERTRVEKRLRALLARLDEAHLPDGLIPEKGAWAAVLRERVAAGVTAEFAEFVRHLARLSSARPSQKWRRECAALADAASGRETVVECVRALAEDEPLSSAEHGPYADWLGDYEGDRYRYLVHQNQADFARGIVWAAALTGGPDAVPRLAALALRAAVRSADLFEDLKLAGAAINALGAVEDPAALGALIRLQAKVRNRALRKQLDAALRTAAERRGVTPEQLVERAVPSCGLGPDGALERVLGGHTARAAIVDAATVRLTFTGPGGTSARTAPAALKSDFPGELDELKAVVKEVRATLSGERARVEALMSDDRVWPYAEWREHYLDHPVTGVLARGLIWEFRDEGGDWRASLGAPDGEPERVRLWHPIRATAAEIRAWRERIADAQVRQPFKQAFREIYLLTPAETETGGYSNRFAAHIVHYRRLYALFKERGWQANFLGRYEGGHNGEARGEFGGGAWRACFYHDPADDADWGPEHATTDQVRFERGDGRAWREAPLADVPPVVFSEAMRDVDLFVGVTSIAADADWADRGDDRYAAYWRETTFGELTASAEVRRAALERILPRTKIADRCSIDGRYLVVRGELRTYRIHLGSSNILMEPDGAYLCIVQARKAPGKLYLPFEDERLSLILSKAFLLAADDRITDPAIRSQIRPVIA